LEKEIPQELHQEIQAQMASCSSIIHSKDELISEFQRQLRGKDEEYVRTLRQQSEDVDELLGRIRREFKEMQAEYDKELDSIEEAYLEERERTIADHSADIDAMFDQRRNKETFYKDTKQKREEQYQREIDDLITKGADQYNKLKIELELNIQTLKQQLEEIRATYQLNTEKLDYNYRVLTELDVEKNAELARYKRRLTKLKDQLNQLVTKYTEMEAADTKMNHELTEDYRSLTQKYKDLQAKFRHFEVADTNKYDEVWVMHEDEAKDLVDQLLKADKIVSEQQLCWRWEPPDMQALQAVLGRHGNIGLAGAFPNVSDRAADAEEGAEGGSPLQSGAAFDNAVREGQRKVAGTRIRAMLRMLAAEAGFLVNPQVQQSISELPDDEAELSQAESMLKALGVKSEEKLNTLVTYFFTDNSRGQGVSTASADDEENNEQFLHNAPEDVAELRDMIRAEDVIAAVKSYIEDVMVDGPVGAPVASARAREEEERIRLKRLNSIKSYWVHLSQVVSDENVEVWKQLERNCSGTPEGGPHTYNNMYSLPLPLLPLLLLAGLKELLHRRTVMIAEVDSMERKNVEMKRLLNHYLGDITVNSSLQVPPAQVMKVRAVPIPKGRNRQGLTALGSGVEELSLVDKKKGRRADFRQTR
jgi:dynein regulatory complex protein 1